MRVAAKRLSDKDRALLFLYVTQVGVPKWAQGRGEQWQVPVLAKLQR